jgi:hypothetical protein
MLIHKKPTENRLHCFPSVALSLSVSLSVTHTHTHTHTLVKQAARYDGKYSAYLAF